MNEEKIKKIIELLQDLPNSQWEILKMEIDRMYEKIKKRNVPNSELETFQEYLNSWVENLAKYKV